MFSVNILTELQGEASAGSCNESPHFLQSGFWAEFKSHHGWKAFRFYVELRGAEFFADGLYPLSVLVRTFKGLFSLAYAPMALALREKGGGGPSLFFESPTNYEAVKEYLQIVQKSIQVAKKSLPKNLCFARFDFPLCYNDGFTKDAFVALCRKARLKKAGSDIQPPDTVVLDLRPSCDDLLAKMKPKWRYNVRLAEKKGVSVQRGGAESIDVFYKLYEETSKRDGIALHAKSYYEDLFNTAEVARKRDGANPTVSMYIASFEGEALAAIITLFSPEEAVYLYGASSNSRRNLMPAYLLQWSAIQDAKAYGCKTYDFYGIPPVEDERHPMYGLYRFKTGFGGGIVHRVGSVDCVFSPLYYAYSLAEKLRGVWFKKLKKLFVRKGK